MELIPGLPNDIALQCLIRVPFNQFERFKSIWKSHIDLPELLRLRKSARIAQPLVVVSQQKFPTGKSDSVFCLVVFEPETGCWWEMPTLPESNKLQLFPYTFAVGSDLVVLAGYDLDSLKSLDTVFIFDFLSSKWRRGTNIPSGPRWFFGSATDGDQTIFVAGGVNDEGNALQSAWAYNVATDNWARLPDIPNGCPECKGLFHRGKFHVTNKYSKSLEIFDTSTRQWLENGDVLSQTIHSPRRFIEVMDKKLYTGHVNDVVVLEDGKWKFVARLPLDLRNTTYFLIPTTIPGHLLLIFGTEKYDAYYKLDMRELSWTKLQVPMEYSGEVFSSCCLII